MFHQSPDVGDDSMLRQSPEVAEDSVLDASPSDIDEDEISRIDPEQQEQELLRWLAEMGLVVPESRTYTIRHNGVTRTISFKESAVALATKIPSGIDLTSTLDLPVGSTASSMVNPEMRRFHQWSGASMVCSSSIPSTLMLSEEQFPEVGISRSTQELGTWNDFQDQDEIGMKSEEKFGGIYELELVERRKKTPLDDKGYSPVTSKYKATLESLTNIITRSAEVIEVLPDSSPETSNNYNGNDGKLTEGTKEKMNEEWRHIPVVDMRNSREPHFGRTNPNDASEQLGRTTKLHSGVFNDEFVLKKRQTVSSEVDVKTSVFTSRHADPEDGKKMSKNTTSYSKEEIPDDWNTKKKTDSQLVQKVNEVVDDKVPEKDDTKDLAEETAIYI